jgi:hypothetical protein
MVQISNPPPRWEVKTIVLPSGDQSGSLGPGTPPVFNRVIVPPVLGTIYNPRRSSILDAKQIFVPSGDQQGEDSSTGVFVSCVSPVPSIFATHTSGLPDLLKIIATFFPSGEIAALVFNPPYLAKGRRSPVVRLCE